MRIDSVGTLSDELENRLWKIDCGSTVNANTGAIDGIGRRLDALSQKLDQLMTIAMAHQSILNARV